MESYKAELPTLFSDLNFVPYGPGVHDVEDNITSLTSYDLVLLDPVVFYRQRQTRFYVSN